MENSVSPMYEILQKLTGLHRSLLEVVRLERKSLVDADLKSIQTITTRKQNLVEEIRQAEALRVKATTDLSITWKKPIRELTLNHIIIEIQGRDPKGAEQLRTAFNTMTLLVQRITEQNVSNRSLVEDSLKHVHEMKKNVLGEAQNRSSTYAPDGKKTMHQQSARIFTGEA